MQSTTDVVIAGGGVIGCAIAYQLRRSGVDVAVLDQGEIGAEASSAAAGLLAPLGSLSGPGVYADLLLASFALFPALVPELEDASGMHLEPGIRATGRATRGAQFKAYSRLAQAYESVATAGAANAVAHRRRGTPTRAAVITRCLRSHLRA